MKFDRTQRSDPFANVSGISIGPGEYQIKVVDRKIKTQTIPRAKNIFQS